MIRLILITLLASAFFSSTYVLNELMSAAGGHWFWSASLRYLFILIILTLIIAVQHGLDRIAELWAIFSRHWMFWTLTGSIGFGVFYAGLCFAADHVSGWVVAATFMFTVVASLFVLMAFGHRFDKKFIVYAVLVLVGVILVNLSEALGTASSSLINTSLSDVLIYGALPCFIAAFSFPIGSQLVWQASYNARQLNYEAFQKNNKRSRYKDQDFWDNEGFEDFEALTTIAPRIVALEMDEYLDSDSPNSDYIEPLPKSKLETLVAKIPTIPTRLLSNSFNKVWLMTLGSIPFWIILSLILQPKLPDTSQVLNVALVALLSGIIATSIFLYAREMAETSSEMAGVDATQASEVIFALVGGIILLGNPLPSGMGIIGIVFIMVGLLLFAKDG